MKLFIAACLVPVVCSCAGCRDSVPEDDRFVGIASRCLESMREMDPESATSLGDHRWDDRLTDRSRRAIAARIALHRAYLDSLRAIDPAKLAPANSIDRRILMHELESSLFTLETLRPQDWNPLWYNPGNAIYALIAREFAPLPERLRAVKARLEALPDVVTAAKANLRNPPRVHAETAVLQNDGNIGLIRADLGAVLAQAPEMEAELAPAREAAVATLEDYGHWLRGTLLPEASGEFRLGAEKFRRKLAFSLESDLTPEEILASARRDLEATRSEMAKVARGLYATWHPDAQTKRELPNDEVIRAVLDRLAQDRPTNETIVDRARATLAACEAFARAKGFVTVPDEPLEIIVMPEYQRGVAVAYCDSPGPLDTGQKTFFSIAPTPADWPAQRVESFFREYNDHMLQVLTIHEAMPGHYLQLVFSNRYRGATPVRALLANGPFVEGWATYSEQLMTEAGYGGPEVMMQELKMRLRMIINAIIDQGVHMRGMTEKEAMDLMMGQGFQEEGEAAGKWRRAVMSSAQLSTYYVGNLELNRLRADAKAKLGDRFDLRTFNDELISYGSPAPKYVRELMGL